MNGEKYIFSEHVIESGNMLFAHFSILRSFVNNFYCDHFGIKENKKNFIEDLDQLKSMIARFDSLWCEYEQKYVFELMVIENDARRFIIESINIESVLRQPHMQQYLMRDEFNQKRMNLLEKICSVNAVANIEGKGRDDFKFEILTTSEDVLGTKATKSFRGFSKAVQNLATKVIDSFNAYRKLIHTYEENIEVIDPQLRNNQALVEVL